MKRIYLEREHLAGYIKVISIISKKYLAIHVKFHTNIGNRTDGEFIDAVAVKVAESESANEYLEHEKDIYKLINENEHESIPKFYSYFPSTNNRSLMFATELLGNNLIQMLREMKMHYFSTVTSMRIGLKVVIFCTNFTFILSY